MSDPLRGDDLPHRFGRYLLFDRIGQGGMAELFLARQATELGGGKLFVVKLILPHFAERSDFAAMLVDEAKLAAGLSHANIVQVVDLGREVGPQTHGEIQDRLFIAMEYVEGFDLAALLKRCSKEQVALPTELALHAVIELLGALEYAHKKHVVHRDVSPSNVLVSFDGEVKLCDFGIARANTAVTSHGEKPSEAIQGKAGYMSPEQARGDALDGRADIFAAGIILWELLAGRKLYRGNELIEQARAANIPELPARDLPDEPRLHAIAKRALAANRDDRYATAGEMRSDLLAWTAAAKLGANPIRLGEWLNEHFGQELVAQRRAREAAAKALDPSPKPARALLTPSPPTTRAEEAPRISYKPDDELQPESLAPVELRGRAEPATGISPPSEKIETPARPTSSIWIYVAAAVVVVAALVWLFRR